MRTEALRILLIEDNPGDAGLVQEALRAANSLSTEIYWVQRLDDGLKHLRENRVDVVLLDLNLPDSAGPETVRAILSADGETPIVVLTGVEDQELANDALREGAQDYVVKGASDGPTLVRSIRYSIERKRAGKALRESEERYRTIVETAQEGIWTVDAENRTTYVNQRMAEMLGYAADELVGRAVFEGMGEAGRVMSARDLECPGKGMKDKHEVKLQRKDGTYLWASMSISRLLDDQGRFAGVLAMVMDVTDRKNLERRLERLALYDSLTRLPNRALFGNRLDHALKRSARDETCVALLFLDLDRFKVINDTLGHLAGDELLQMVAQRIETCFREEDTIARLGGDEFAVLLEAVDDISEARSAADRLIDAFEAPFEVMTIPVNVTASIGIAISSVVVQRPEDLLRHSDVAMYRAKRRDGSAYHVFDPTVDASATERLHRENELREATERGEFL
ncbi:MAG: diguanylate cyclase domain-containing protein [Gemmatimonadota bacterium]